MTAPDVCRSCDAPIAWARTIAGKAMPIDANPDGTPRPIPDGNLTITTTSPLTVDLVPVGTLFETEGLRYRSHFATCPNAGAWRRPR